MSALTRDPTRPHGGNVIQLQTRTGPIEASVFVTEGERSIGIVLYRQGKAIAAQSFDGATLRRVKTDVLGWLTLRRLDDQSKVALIDQVRENYETLVSIRANGPDIAQGWLGSHTHRRLPEIVDVA